MTERAKTSSASKTKTLLGDVIGAVALTMVGMAAATSFAALLFSGPAVDGLAAGISSILVASAIVTVVIGIWTRFPLVIGGAQDIAAISLAPAVAVISTNSTRNSAAEIGVLLALSALSAGVVMLLIGRFRLGGSLRSMPTTVVAGFVAGTGWLLLKGGFDVMTNRSLGGSDLDNLVQVDLIRFWLPGLLLGTLIAAVPLSQRLSPVLSSAFTIAMAIGFYAMVAAMSSIQAVEDGGWLVGPFPETASFRPITPAILADLEWSVIGGSVGSIGVAVILSLLGMLFNLAGLQKVKRVRIDLDHELMVAGAANVLIAPVGGLVGYHLLGDSVLADKLGVVHRAVPIMSGITVGIFAFTGGELVGYLPRFIAGGLLVGAGLSLLFDWFRELRTATSSSDRAVSCLIVAVIAGIGILEGIVVGVVAACLLFVVRYSQIDPVRLTSSGSNRHSVVSRTEAERNILDDHGDRIAIYELHGYLFFGSACGVADQIRARVEGGEDLTVVVLDFWRVSGFDSSAFAALAEVAAEVAAAGAQLSIAGLRPSDANALALACHDGDVPSFFADLDAALEAAEFVVVQEGQAESGSFEPAAETVGDHEYSSELRSYFIAVTTPADEVIFEGGDDSDALYLLTKGRVRIIGRDAGGRTVRLRTLRAGSILGEIGFLAKVPRTAAAIAETDVELQVLSRDAHDRLRTEQPEVLIELYDQLLRRTADRAADIHVSLTQALR